MRRSRLEAMADKVLRVHGDKDPERLTAIRDIVFTLGAELRDLYVVTGSGGTDSDRAGSIYRLAVDVPGLAVPLARVRPQVISKEPLK